jgi:hypothetical protein
VEGINSMNTVIIPEGWMLVPIEPTEAMLIAGDAFCDGLTSLSMAYEAMLNVVMEEGAPNE